MYGFYGRLGKEGRKYKYDTMPPAAAGVALARQTRVAAAAATQPVVALPLQPVALAQDHQTY